MKHLPTIGTAARRIAACIAALVLLTPPVQAELVAWWDFNQPAVNGKTLDQRGGQIAQLLGGAVLTPDAGGRTGLPGDAAARFGTGAQRLRSTAAYFTNAFAGNTGTISFWIKHTTFRNATAISFVAPSVIGARGWQTHAPWSDGNIYSDSGGCCDGTMRTAGAMGALVATWHHVALVRGPDIALGEPDRTNKWIYVDGGLIASGTNDATIAVPFTELFIGNAPNTGEAVDGDIDDVAILSQPLSQAEVSQLAGGASPLTFATAPSDSDMDGLPDLWELYYVPGNLMALGAEPGDLDMDGLTDAAELLLGTNPNASDTDNDGLSDKVETGTGIWIDAMDTGTNPFVADTDGDTLLDGVETNTGSYSSPTNTGTNPHLADTDGDLIDDALEILYGSSPTNPASTPIQPGVPTLLAWWPFNDAANPAIATDTRVGLVANMVGTAAYSPDGGGRTGAAGDRALNTATGGGNGLRASLTNWLNIGTRANKLTVMFWQRNTTNPQASSFWMNSPAPGIGGRGMQAHVPWSDGNIYFDHAGAAPPATRISGSPAIDWTQWHHFAFVKDGGKKTVYIDGVVFLNQDTGAAAFPTDFNTLFIGYNGTANSVDGQMDDFAVFASGVGADDIMSVASGAKTPLDITTSSDADADGLPDSWEYSYFPGDLTKLGKAPADLDMDGSLDVEEIVRNTDPTDDDSDDDGLKDGPETKTGMWVSASATGTDPLKADTDGDGLRDDAENCSGIYVSPANPGTNPNLFDTDMDGFSDSVEGPYGSNPNVTASVPFTPGSSFLLAYWNFNDATDPAAAIDSVVGHTGVVTATYSAPGGGASGSGSDRAMCYAPGQNVIVDANFVNLASSGNKLTISFWQKLNSTTMQSSSFWIRSPSSTGTARGFQAHSPWSDGNIYFDHSGCCTAGVNRLSGPIGAIDATQWRHYAFVKDGNTKTVYIDGVPILTGSGTAPLASDFTDLQIGNGAAAIDGCLDEFAIFAGALDMEQIARLAGGETADTILAPPVELRITDFQFNPTTEEFTVSWNSKPNRFYGLYFSFDLMNFDADITDSIPSQGTTTTYGPFTLPFAFDFSSDSIYFRVRDASP
jgi:hypothetical protein